MRASPNGDAPASGAAAILRGPRPASGAAAILPGPRPAARSAVLSCRLQSARPVQPPDDVIAELQRQVGRAVSRLCPHWLTAERDDIIQLAMLRVLKVVPSGEGTAPTASSYVWRTAFSVVVDEIRRRSRRPEVPLEEHAVAETVAGEGIDPERRAIARQTGVAIRACLQKLVSARRSAVVLHLQGHAVPDVAKLLGWDAKKAENAVYRGMMDLRGCLRSKGVQA
jgi:RNA polymerase sigma-70 factor (ECF subfamily)